MTRRLGKALAFYAATNLLSAVVGQGTSDSDSSPVAADAATPSGGWVNGVDWSKIFPSAAKQADIEAQESSNVEQFAAMNTVTPQVTTEVTSVETIAASPPSDNGSSAGSSTSGNSATCPPGCKMTIVFSDDSLNVPFVAGNHGTPSKGETQGTCICLREGSVRVNIGATGIYDHSTLIEGNAEGLDSSSSFFDVSYVEGYSYPVVCWTAAGSMSGSNIDLYTRGKCPGGQTKMGEVCINPGFMHLAQGGDSCWECTLPDAFFGPASGAAYTYPRDDSQCSSSGGSSATPMGNGGQLTCCVGPKCRENTQSKGGQTSGGRCDSGCQPCAGHGQCSSCGKGAKRSLEEIFESAGPSARNHKRHVHRHSARHIGH